MIFEKVYDIFKSMVYSRADDNGCVFYFTADDFDGLHKVPYTFKSTDGHDLKGAFYFYDGYDESRLIIFDHGMGSGHTGYMKEIEILARNGYRVFSYDHTGCMESGGDTTGGFVQSLKDLNVAVSAIKADEKYKNLDISVMGHSWGAFSTMNICALHPDISHIVALSGFISVSDVLRQFFSGILSPFYKKIYALEEKANPEFIKFNAVDSLKNSKVKALIVISDDDKTIKCEKHFDVLQKALKDKENITFLKVSGKNHNPNYTEDAVKYKDEFFKQYSKALKKNLLRTEEDKKSFKAKYDWDRMTRQDEKLWAAVLEHLKG